MPNQSISRYVFAGLAFVLFFVGIAYIAYRFSNRAANVTLVAPSPSPTVVSAVPATINQRLILPPTPSQRTIAYLPPGAAATNRTAASSYIASQPVTHSVTTDPNLIALKRDELVAKYQLDQSKLQAETRITLAKLEADLAKNRLNAQNEQQKSSQDAAAATQKRTLWFEAYKVDAQYDLARRQLELQRTNQQ